MRSEIPFSTSTVRYIGSPNAGDYEVLVDREGRAPYKLDARNDIVNHSPDGVSWGYNGSGPAQCALAILADYFSEGTNPKYQHLQDYLDQVDGNEFWISAPNNWALLFYQSFKSEVISRFPMDESWELTGEQITKLIDEKCQPQA